MNHFTHKLAFYVRSLENAVISELDNGMAQVAQMALTQIKKDWPDSGRKSHEYATGRSKDAWEVHKVGVCSYVLVNDARGRSGNAYAIYTNKGYTRKGPRTARSFKRRQVGESYGSKSLDRIRERAIIRLKQRLARVRVKGGK